MLHLFLCCLSFHFYSFLCVRRVCFPVCILCACSTHRSHKKAWDGYPGTGVADGCELPCGICGLSLGPLERQPYLLTPELLLSLWIYGYLSFNWNGFYLEHPNWLTFPFVLNVSFFFKTCISVYVCCSQTHNTRPCFHNQNTSPYVSVFNFSMADSIFLRAWPLSQSIGVWI